jgi:hypothetical protein
MASTYSNLKIQLMATGENSGTWGNVTNVNLGTALEEAIVGSADVNFSSADVTLTLTDTNSSQSARNLRLNLTGSVGAPQNLIVPSIEKVYIVNNGLTQIITVKNSTGTGIAVPAGKTVYVYNDGTNVVDAITHLSSLTVAGDVSATNVSATNLAGSGSAITALNATAVSSGVLAVSYGGTGANTLTANAVITGNGTSAVGAVAPGTSGNVLVSNGSAWTSAAPAAQGFDSGTVMIFAQTAAPTGWTKDTSNYNNSGLRVVTGSASTGGSVDFTTAFASKTPTGSVTISSVSGSAGATTLSTPQIPSHSHTYGVFNAESEGAPNIQATKAGIGVSPTTKSTAATGGGGSHTHPFSFSSGSASFSGNAINLAVKYVDVIRATKN